MSPMQLFSICFSWCEEESPTAEKDEGVKCEHRALAYFVLCDCNQPWRAVDAAVKKFRSDFPGDFPTLIEVNALQGSYIGEA